MTTTSNENAASLRGIRLVEVTDRGEREHLGSLKGEIEIDGGVYTVWPNSDGGAHLAGTRPRTDVWSSGGAEWVHSSYTLNADGTVENCAGRVGEIIDGAFRHRYDLLERDLGLAPGSLS